MYFNSVMNKTVYYQCKGKRKSLLEILSSRFDLQIYEFLVREQKKSKEKCRDSERELCDTIKAIPIYIWNHKKREENEMYRKSI